MTNLNRKQRASILLGVILTVFTWLVPPYIGECFARADEPNAFMGVRFLYDPPERVEVSKVVWGQPVVTCRARIDRERANHQYIGIVIMTTGLVMALGNRRRPLGGNLSQKP